jgi:hypothetical protein
MKQIFTFLFFIVFLFTAKTTFAQPYPTIYASKQSGLWATVGAAGTWETFAGNATNTPGALGTGSIPATSAPSGTHFIYVRSGHTVSMAASKNCLGVTIESGGSLVAGTAAAVTLKLAAGGTGFTAPLSYNVTNNGTLGQAAEVITAEIPNTAGTVIFTGSGTYSIARIRMVGGSANNPVVTIDANMSLTQTANYALAASYTPAAGDNYTLNINAGKTVTITSPSGYFHTNSASSTGTYTYNINGTLDLSASTQTGSNLTAISPTDGIINVNVGSTGLIKTGAAFNSSPAAPGIANLNIAAGGAVDATLATVFNFNGNAFATTNTSTLQRTVLGDGSTSLFPVKTSGGNNTPVTISRAAGTSGIYAVTVQNTFTNAPADPTKCVQKQWNIAITGTPSVADTLRFSWLASDNGSAFTTGSVVTIGHYTAGAYEYKNATVSGTGIAADPYVAKVWGFTSYSPFIVSNLGALPLRLLSFDGSYNGKQTSLRWETAEETGVRDFVIEKSTNGTSYAALATVSANNNATAAYAYTDGGALSTNTYYRLKMRDLDGRFTYSNVVFIRIGKNAAGIKVYPNPATDVLVAEHAPATENTVINIYTADGKLLISKKAAAGSVKTSVNVTSLNTGKYLIAVSDDNGKSTMNFIRQ